jgi:hypothetical protein
MGDHCDDRSGSRRFIGVFRNGKWSGLDRKSALYTVPDHSRVSLRLQSPWSIHSPVTYGKRNLELESGGGSSGLPPLFATNGSLKLKLPA